jgi:hypothetical protein
MSIAHDITHSHTETEVAVSVPLSKAEIYARAEQQMHRGKQMVISGFVVAVLGIVAYCVVGLSAGVNQQLGSAFVESAGWLTGATLGVIGFGTLLWLVGSFLYVSGGMDSDPDGPDLNF